MQRYRRDPDIESAPMPEDTILYNPSASNFCMLNQTAAHVWEKLASPASTDELVSSIREHFSVGETDAVERDVRETLRQFQDMKMVVPVQDA
ncbi:MAG: PqqD family protein [Gemmatimonadales bacterium]